MGPKQRARKRFISRKNCFIKEMVETRASRADIRRSYQSSFG
jgi:hypothetical protein